MLAPQPILLISGAPGAGKTTVAEELCRRFPLAMHIPVDDLRGWVRSGHAGPLEWTDETTTQFVLARRSAARIAADYTDAGFVVIIDDVVRHADLGQYLDHLGGRDVKRVLLAPGLEEVLRRNAVPGRKTFDTAVLERLCRDLHRLLLDENTPARGWLVLDSRTASASETANAILRT